MEEDDDFGFTMPTGKSRLSSLFPSDNVKEDDVNQSLTYVPPKQPKKNAPTASSSASSSKNLALLHVISAYTYKLEGDKYVSVGKLGVAILGNKESAIYKLLVYRGKSEQITMCTITLDFKFSVELNNYAKFFDDKGENWSVMFQSENELITFAKQITLARVNSCGKVNSNLVVQDLVFIEGRSIENGDSVDLIYTGWLFTNQDFGQVFDENVKTGKQFIVQLGKTKVIKGLSDGLLGMKKHSRRLLFIPPSLAYGADGLPKLVPPESTLIFEIYAKKVKIVRDASESPSPSRSRKGSESKPEVPRRTHSVSDDSIRSRGASISEQLTQSPRKDNAKLISRMAKMGMPLLPVQGTATTQSSSESDAEKDLEPEKNEGKQSSSILSLATDRLLQKDVEVESIPTAQVESIPTAQVNRNLSGPYPAANPQMQPLQVSNVPFSPYPAAYPLDRPSYIQQSMQAHSITPIMPQMVSNVLDSHIPFLMTETRTQNTEVRLALSKISDKVDVVLQKFDDGKYQGDGMSSPYHKQVPYMEGAILAQNIERIIMENSQLKKDNEMKNTKIQELNEKICDILQRNQRFFEESTSVMEQRRDSLHTTTSLMQSKILGLEQEKSSLTDELKEHITKSSEFEEKANKYKNMHEELSKQMTLVQDELKMNQALTNDKNCDSETVINSFKEKLKDMQHVNEELTQKVAKMDNDLQNAQKVEEQLKSQLEEKASLSAALEESQNEVQHWRKKYDNFHENTKILKEKYERQMVLMTTEIKKMKNAVPLQNSEQQGSQDFTSEIKKAMNAVYKMLRSKVKPNDSYTGSELLQSSLSVIQEVTLLFIGKNQQHLQSGNSSSTHKEEVKIEERAEPLAQNPKESAAESPKQPETVQAVETSSLQTEESLGNETHGNNVIEKPVEVSDAVQEENEAHDENADEDKNVIPEVGADEKSEDKNASGAEDMAKIKLIDRKTPDNNLHQSSSDIEDESASSNW